tara:strand:- start:373 stop:630 length:258 start_codon:yes stop_codon:yes gene_type:complete
MKKNSNDLYKVNSKLKKILKQLVKENIKSSARKDAMYILTNCDETVKEFLFFALSDNGNLTCTCLDFAKDKNGNKLKTPNFGNDY